MRECDGTAASLNQVGPILNEPVVSVAHIRTGQAAVVEKLVAINTTLFPGRAKAACGHIRDGILHFSVEVADGLGTTAPGTTSAVNAGCSRGTASLSAFR